MFALMVFKGCVCANRNYQWNKCGYQFHPKPSPHWNKPPGHDLKRAKTLPLGQSLCTKTLPSGQNRESKAPFPGHKVRKFHQCIYKP